MALGWRTLHRVLTWLRGKAKSLKGIDQAQTGKVLVAKKTTKKASVSKSKSQLLPKSAKTTSVMTVSRHTYQLVYVPDSCALYNPGDNVDVMVNDPAPMYLAIDFGGDCDGCLGRLAD